MEEAAQGTFGGYGDDERGPRQWLAALLTSSVVYVGLGALALVVGTTAQQMVQEKKVDVTFVEKVLKPEPPPPVIEPPKPVDVPKPAAPAAAAPAIPKDMKIRRLDKPPPPKELVAPRDAPKDAPAEADPSQDKGIAVYGEAGKGDPAGLEGGLTQGGVVGGQVGGAIALPEDAEAPVPVESNVPPEYPQEARADGRSGTVVLKVIVAADGHVSDVQVMRGEEPFVSAAIKAVKNWKYEPARYKGQPITVYRIVQIPFKLNV